MSVRVGLRKVGVASMFLGPNLLGFLLFTLGPLVTSLVLAFSDWDLRRHNQFHPDEKLSFVGFSNFTRLLSEPGFWRFFGNTLVLMLGIPFSVAGSLGVALLLSREMGVASKTTGIIAALLLAAVSAGAMALAGGGAGVALLVGGLLAGSLIGGVLLGGTVYRTLLYLPSFTSGVATILLWKNLYNPHTGPINAVLTPALNGVATATNAVPAGLFRFALFLLAGAAFFIFWKWLRRLHRSWADGELGTTGYAIATGIGLVPFLIAGCLIAPDALWPILVVGGLLVVDVALPMRRGRQFRCASSTGAGGTALLTVVVGTAQLALMLFGLLLWHLPDWAKDGLHPPGWHTDYDWAKPSIILIGLWASLGSNHMLLYLAGLTGVPTELYEAADIDGVSPGQRFWHITWPQLAPTTFFIVVMSVIGGLQGGFEIARTLTRGGPDGSTTTLSYFIYNEGFVTGRLGYSSAIAWVLFAIVFAVTVFNWKFGNRYVND